MLFIGDTMKKSYFNFFIAILSILFSIFLFNIFISEILYKLISPGTFLCYSIIIFTAYFIYMLIIFLFTKSINKNTIRNLVILYFLMILFLTFDKGSFFRINLNPLRLIYQLKLNFISATLELIGNLLIYVPLGIYIRKSCNKKNNRLFLYFLIYILFIESIQAFFHRGVFDINDIITNSLGFYLGLLLKLPRNKYLKIEEKKDDFA